ncbi:unnamed protein product [Acanthoscelides obtectus]|uniref:Uncharacterized protein n=1 Tax=Acanthoscelides obtectus TaxID=200917 RepID=A0A9P0PR23_ACAOB|nr:unnamed protein product [Acanthoscelides obtectus]
MKNLIFHITLERIFCYR